MSLIMRVIKLILEILFIKVFFKFTRTSTDSVLIHLRDSVKPLLYFCIFFLNFIGFMVSFTVQCYSSLPCTNSSVTTV